MAAAPYLSFVREDVEAPNERMLIHLIYPKIVHYPVFKRRKTSIVFRTVNDAHNPVAVFPPRRSPMPPRQETKNTHLRSPPAFRTRSIDASLYFFQLFLIVMY